jgi:hypothetical protein
MRAAVGDELTVTSHRVGEPARHGVITAVRSADGAPPYVVRWDDGHEATFFPSADTVVVSKTGLSGRSSPS